MEMTNNIKDIAAEVAELGDKELILEVVKAIGWEISEAGHYATKPDGSTFLLADPGTLGRCILGNVFDITSDRIQWAPLHEVVSTAWAYPFDNNFDMVLSFMIEKAPRDTGRLLASVLMFTPRQLCECIVIAQRMR